MPDDNEPLFRAWELMLVGVLFAVMAGVLTA